MGYYDLDSYVQGAVPDPNFNTPRKYCDLRHGTPYKLQKYGKVVHHKTGEEMVAYDRLVWVSGRLRC